MAVRKPLLRQEFSEVTVAQGAGGGENMDRKGVFPQL